MERFEPTVLVTVAGILKAWATTPIEDTELSERPLTDAIPGLETLGHECEDLGLTTTRKLVKRTVRLLSRPEPLAPGKFQSLCSEILARLHDELDGVHLMALSAKEVGFYEDWRTGWEEVLGAFPKTIDDIEEASKCYALARYAASIFHVLQAVEIGLIELGTFINVTDPKSGWTAVTAVLKKIVKKDPATRTPFEKENFAFLEQVDGAAEAIKTAWRNKISHAQGRLVLLSANFTPEIAEEILFAARAFLRRLADGLAPVKAAVAP